MSPLPCPGSRSPAALRSKLRLGLPAALLLGGLLLPNGRNRPGEVLAGDYHDQGTLDCSQCHVMHTGPAPVEHATRGDRSVVGALLRPDVNELCLSCHDGSSRASDVLGRNQGRNPTDVRQAGSLNALGRDGGAPTGHTLYSLDVAPGSDPPWSAEVESGSGRGLNCIHCHAPHGSRDGDENAYRNLRSDAGNNRRGQGLVTYNAGRPGSNDLSRDVYVRRALSYDESAVDFNEPSPRDSAMARFCAGCHDRFHGIPGVDANIGGLPSGRGLTAFVRHPSSGVDLGALEEGTSPETYLAHVNRVKVLSSTGSWDGVGGQLTPTCISCHKAHGNGNAFGLIYRSGRGTPTEDGDTQGGALEDLCHQCHGPTPFGP